MNCIKNEYTHSTEQLHKSTPMSANIFWPV